MMQNFLKKGHQIPTIAGVALAVTAAGFSLSAQAGKITSELTPTAPTGHGGWNLENVEVILNGAGSVFNEVDGSYLFSADSDNTYVANVYDDTYTGPDTALLMGLVLAKDWPIGEPSGIKIINGDGGVKPPKPTNCIMATSYLEGHFLDSTDPQQVTCSGPFQSHKRFKVAMLPLAVDGIGSDSVDLVFNVEAEEGSRDYQMFQKINNWTDGRLQGFTIQLGFGVGENFVPASSSGALDNLNISVPSDIWSPNQLANFSAGLFGPLDKHTGKRGFFDPDTRAGFIIDEYVAEGSQPLTDTLTATTPLPSNYNNVPPGAGDTANQFGPWLPSTMLPYGIFFDDDGNPETDAALLAWYGHNPARESEPVPFSWMAGSDQNFAEIPTDTIEAWGENLLYTMGEIDDLVNVGLNYVITIGDVSTFPSSTFTIRITPTPEPDSDITLPPTYVGQPPSPLLLFRNSDAAVSLDPRPEFVVGSLLTARVGDADLNLNPAEAEEVLVQISSSTGQEEDLILIEQGANRGVFAATLPEAFSNVAAGTVVTMTYTDADDGNGGIDVIKRDSTTAITDPVTVTSDVSITDFSVPASLFNGQTRSLKLSIANARGVEAATGSVLVVGTVDGNPDIVRYEVEFTDLKANGKAKFNWKWTANLVNPDILEEVTWTATVTVEDSNGDPQEVDEATGTTTIEVKKGKNSNK